MPATLQIRRAHLGPLQQILSAAGQGDLSVDHDVAAVRELQRMEGILLETMYDLPSLDGCEQVVIGPEVIDGKARPLYIYSDKVAETASSA